MRPDNFIYFSSYGLSGLMSLLFSFFLMLLEHYGLQLQHLSPHSITLLTIFVHFCEMFVGVRPSVNLLHCFHMFHSVSKHPPRIGGYYFQHRTKGPPRYIPALSPDKWDHWREDWVLVQPNTHERSVLPTAVPMALCADWEQDPG
jgi:hypothetical protein